ncbi:MAG TPA: zinc ribbon domain-containing protein [Nitrospirota bacterium]|nr:zinc ribbon domain-containing protein [Nitrospirota bacterium]
MISHDINKKYALIVLENLKIQAMSVSAKGGTLVIIPGKSQSRSSGSPRRSWIGDGLSSNDKSGMRWTGDIVVFVDLVYSSREYSVCGHVSPLNRLSQEKIHSIHCEHAWHDDANAAKVVLSRSGNAQVVCGSNGAVMPSVAEANMVAA